MASANVVFEYDAEAKEYGMRTDGLILWSQQRKLATAVAALSEWQLKALEIGVSVTQLNLTLLDDGEETPTPPSEDVTPADADGGPEPTP